MSKQRSNTLKVPLYGNCKVQNPDGVHIFNCGEKKAKWYLKRDLADVIQQTPLIIRLKFVPNGQGHANDSFYLQERQNICVVCGTTDKLTKHHVVPFMYRRFFPDKLKDHTAYDVLPLCYDCHEEYESFANQLKKELADELSIPRGNNVIVDTEIRNVCLAASALLRHKNSIPDERQKYLIKIIRNYYEERGQLTVTSADIENAANLNYNTDRKDFKHEGLSVVESLTDIEGFIKRWRQHFLDIMEPSYMPKYWIVDRPI